MKGIIRKYNGHGGYVSYYIDYEGSRYWYASGYQRTTIWRTARGEKEIKVLIYPCYPYMDNYVNKQVNVKGI